MGILSALITLSKYVLLPEIIHDPFIPFHFGIGPSNSALLEISEELIRGGHEVPDDKWLMAMAGQSKLWHQVAVLFLSLRKQDIGEIRGLVATAPVGGELFERIRNHILSQEN